MEHFAKAFETFFVRWRLEHLIAPFLPSPLRPQVPVAILASVLGHMRGGGQTFYMPDTFPIPTRDELRDMLEDALRGAGSPKHLAEWLAIVRTQNAAKTAISRYARLFAVQHYYRILFQRHASSLRRGKALVTVAFASYWCVSTDTIENDLFLITSRLGEEWYLASTPLPSQDQKA